MTDARYGLPVFGDTSYSRQLVSDGRYGQINYGGSLYGQAATTSVIWAIEVDWDGDGTFNGDNEAVHCKGLSLTRGRQNFLRISGDGKAVGFERVRQGTLRLQLNNVGGRYDPYNSGSPIAAYLEAGKRIRVRVKDYKTAVIHNVFDGVLADVRLTSGNDETCTLVAVDGLQWLSDIDIDVDTLQDVTVDEAIAQILISAAYPAYWGSSIAPTADLLNYWWASGRAIDEINDLADADFGVLFAAADGKITYHGRNTTSPLATTITQNDILADISLPMPYEVQRNHIKLIARPLTLGATSELWAMTEKPQLAVGETVEYWAQFSYGGSQVPAINLVTPSAPTDFTANDSQDGSGTDVSASFIVAIYNFGKTAKVTVKNNGAVPAYLTFLRLRGDPIYNTSPVTITRTVGAGNRTFELDSPWLQNSNLASSLADYMKLILPTSRKFPTVKVEARPEIQFAPDLFNRVQLEIPAKGITDTYKVAGITHEWLGENGQATLSTLYLEPYYDNGGAWTFPTELGVTSIFGV